MGVKQVSELSLKDCNSDLLTMLQWLGTNYPQMNENNRNWVKKIEVKRTKSQMETTELQNAK